METVKTAKLDALGGSRRAAIMQAAEIIKSGGLVAFPTETVYGLGADALNGAAVKRIFAAKGRPQDNPLIVHISDISMLPPLVKYIPDSAKKCAEKFWPGPFTMILPKSDLIPDEVSAGLETVAVRFPSDPIAQELISAAGTPIAAPSANLSGSPSPTAAEHCVKDLDGRVEAILMGNPCAVGVESTVITLAGERPRLLRPGGVTPEQLRELLPDLEIDRAVLQQPEKGARVASPGMKYKHYSPKTRVIMIEGEPERFAEYVNSHAADGVCALCCDEEKAALNVPSLTYGSLSDDSQKAAELFGALRDVDKMGCTLCYAHAPHKNGVGLAVYNRLIRAAGFEVIGV